MEKCGLFSDFQYGFWFFRSTAYLLTVLSDITRAFNKSAATRVVALDIQKAFDRIWHAGLLHKLKSYGISGQIFGLILSFLSNRQLQVVLDGKHLSFKILGLSFSSKFDSGSYIIFIAKLPPGKSEPQFIL